jgi:hypothetical protein
VGRGGIAETRASKEKAEVSTNEKADAACQSEKGHRPKLEMAAQASKQQLIAASPWRAAAGDQCMSVFGGEPDIGSDLRECPLLSESGHSQPTCASELRTA